METLARRQFLAGVGALLGGTSAGGAEPVPLQVLFHGGDLPAFRAGLEKDYVIKALKAGVKPKLKGDAEDNIEGLEQLETADIWIGSGAKRNLPGEKQLAYFKKFLESGKPFIGYRAASHIFQNWLAADQAVWGATYGGHHLQNKDSMLIVKVAEGAADHPILKGIEPPAPLSGSYNYTKLQADVKVLLYSGLPGNMMPHTSARENTRTKGRAFYTRYDAKQIASEPLVREVFLRGFLWALNRDTSKHRKTS